MGEVLLALLSDGELDGISTWDVEKPWLHGTCVYRRRLTCVDRREQAAVADSPTARQMSKATASSGSKVLLGQGERAGVAMEGR